MAYPTDVTISVAPTGDVVAVSDVRDFLGLPATGSDAGLATIVAAATDIVDGPGSRTGYCFRPHGLKVRYSGVWPVDPTTRPPLDIWDPAAWLALAAPAPTTVSVAYRVIGQNAMASLSGSSVVPVDGREWLRAPYAEPAGYDGLLEVSYTTRTVSVPDGIAAVVMALAAHMWNERSMYLATSLAGRDNAVIDSILARYSVARQAF